MTHCFKYFTLIKSKVYYLAKKNTNMATKKTGRGGARPGAGRKEEKDKKQSVFIWLKTSVIKKHGGKKALKRRLEAELI